MNHTPQSFSPSRVIPIGEDPKVTKAVMEAQIRGMLQVLRDSESLEPLVLGEIDCQLKTLSRKVFVLKAQHTFKARTSLFAGGREAGQ